MGNYFLSPAADDDLLEIWLHIAVEDPDAATRFLDKLEAAFVLLGEMPDMGRNRSIESRIKGTRTFPVGNYLIIYRPMDEGGVAVARVIHAARDYRQFLEE